MCNCNKPSRVANTTASPTSDATSFVLKMKDGTRQTFGSALEANAENARRGYTGRVTPA